MNDPRSVVRQLVTDIQNSPLYGELRSELRAVFSASNEPPPAATEPPPAATASARFLPSEPPADREEHEAWVRAIVFDIDFSLFRTRFWLYCDRDKTDPDGRLYLQIACERPDTFTGLLGEGRGGKAYLSQFQMKDEIVQLAWGLFQNYVTHEAREGFFYAGRRVYGPHQKVDRLWELAEDIVVRP